MIINIQDDLNYLWKSNAMYPATVDPGDGIATGPLAWL